MIQEPPRIAKLPKDKRGYPIPWNVLRGKDGQPIFTVNDDGYNMIALTCQRCPICSDELEPERVWVGGPLSAFHSDGWYLDLPMHPECAAYALQVCPYLAAPKYLGRVDVPNLDKIPGGAVLVDATMIPKRPSLFVAVTAEDWEIQTKELLPYTRPKRPVHKYEYWYHGILISDWSAQPFLRDIFGRDWHPPATK